MDSLLKTYQQAVAHRPGAIAVIAPDGQLTFAELDAWADQIALELIKLSQEKAFGLLFECCLGFYASLVACMKTGRLAYLIDPANVSDTRLNQIGQSEDSLNLACLLSLSNLAEQAQSFAVPVQWVDHMPPSASANTIEIESLPAALHQIKTSGSSGSATRVTIGREALFIHYLEMSQVYGYQAGQMYASFARHTSAAGINHFWRVLLTGAGSLNFDFKQQNFVTVYQLIHKHNIRNLQGVASLLSPFCQVNQGQAVLASIRCLVLGGEPVNPIQLKAIASLLPEECRFVFNYSSTETLHIACFETSLKEALELTYIPCGTALPSRKIEIWDHDGQLQAPGEPGEIIVRSSYLALELQGEHSQRLFADPLNPSQQIYRSRDRGRWNKYGQLEHLGRLDRMLKIKGQRIDPSRIEQHLNQFDGVQQSRVLQVESSGQLVACLLMSEAEVDLAKIQASLEQSLPLSHQPAQILVFSQFPRLLTGKLDTQGLQQLAQEQMRSQDTSSLTGLTDRPLEHLSAQLKACWEKVLGRDVPSLETPFMHIGGDSLKAVLLISELEQQGYAGLSPYWVSQYPSILGQSQALLDRLAPESPQKQTPKALALDKAAILERLGWH